MRTYTHIHIYNANMSVYAYNAHATTYMYAHAHFHIHMHTCTYTIRAAPVLFENWGEPEGPLHSFWPAEKSEVLGAMTYYLSLLKKTRTEKFYSVFLEEYGEDF